MTEIDSPSIDDFQVASEWLAHSLHSISSVARNLPIKAAFSILAVLTRDHVLFFNAIRPTLEKMKDFSQVAINWADGNGLSGLSSDTERPEPVRFVTSSPRTGILWRRPNGRTTFPPQSWESAHEAALHIVQMILKFCPAEENTSDETRQRGFQIASDEIHRMGLALTSTQVTELQSLIRCERTEYVLFLKKSLDHDGSLETSSVIVAPRGKPGRRPDPEKQKHADLVNDLRRVQPPTTWKECADIVNKKFGLEGSAIYTYKTIRDLHRLKFGDKKRD